jgi:type II secretory pathway pseudopilin PulG
LAYCAYCGSYVAQVSFVPCASCGNPTNGGPPRPAAGSGNTNAVALIIGIGVVALGILAFAGILAAIAIPNMITALERSKQKRTMADMRYAAAAIEAYGTDHFREEYPTGTTLAQIRSHLEPKYTKALPLVDGWGHEYRYMPVQGRGYVIVSAGKNMTFEIDSPDEYASGTTSSFDCDIVYANGRFVVYPEGDAGGGR